MQTEFWQSTRKKPNGNAEGELTIIRFRKVLILASSSLAAMLSSCVTPSLSPANIALWRMECGEFHVKNIGGKPRHLSNGCYLIRHGEQYLLWDAGLEETLIGKPEVSDSQTVSLTKALLPQLAEIGVDPLKIGRLGVSHYHGDHYGQAARFPNARLMIGREDWAEIKSRPDHAALVQPWVEGKAVVEELVGDTDVFGDGRVVIVDTPGHTPGHKSLLVHLSSGAVLLTGDAVHFRDQLETGQPSGNHTDKAAGANSIQRMLKIQNEVPAKIIVQHDPLDIGKLPAFPDAAE
jgi:glyoxylase-like metal-dependent hydrolase (beta-lactamase superfamily II)